AEAGSIVTVYDNGDKLGSVVADKDGTWSYTPTTPLNEGPHEFTVDATDEAGNTSEKSDPFNIVTDYTPPTGVTLVIETVAGDDIVNAVEAAGKVSITGSSTGAREGDVVTLTINGKAYSGTVDADGKWTVSGVSGSDLVADSDHIVDGKIRATDVAGNYTDATDSHSYEVKLQPGEVALSINVVTSDDIVNLAESQTEQSISGKATGEFKAGDIVSFSLNGHTYSAAVAADGKWSVNVAGADLAAETNIHATLVAHDMAGNISSVTADHAYAVDIVPPVATLIIDTVAGDDIVNLEESTRPQTISGKVEGEFQAGDKVSFSLNGHDYSTTVNAKGEWSVNVPGADLAAETNIHATLVAHDAAGNSADVLADRAYTVNVNPPVASLNINIVAGDDVVNLEESKVDQAITGSSTGGRAGDVVKIVVNGATYSGTIDSQGKWSINVPGAELVADAGHRIDATFTATNVAGNSASVTASHLYSVDITPPVAQLTINTVAGDDVVNLVESQSQQTISGKATGEFTTGDLVKFTLNGHDYSAAVNASGNWSVAVAGADLAKETNIHATLVAHDTAGNVADVVADHGYSVDIIPPVATLTINVVAGDDIVNYAESQTSQAISGKVGGEFKAGDIVSFGLNGTDYSAVVSASGDWSVMVAGSDLAKAVNIHATLVAHDDAGNATTVVADRSYQVQVEPPVAGLIINVIAGDDVVNIEESKVNQIISGKATGQFKAGDLVSFSLNGHAYSAAVNASGDWNVSVSGADLAKGSSINATLVAHDGAGNASEVPASRPYGVDLTPPVATLTINVVAGDDIVNLAESKAQQTISGKASGEFKAGDLVSFTLNGTTYSAAVNASGNWSVSVAGADLAKATNIHATLVAHDAAGNSADVVADHAYSVDITPPVAQLTINVVAGDDMVNAAEAMTNQTISGKATGEFVAGDIVSFKLNGTNYSAAVAADGKWSVQVSGTDLSKGTSIDATLVAHDVAGNSSSVTANHPYTVDLNGPDSNTTQLTIDIVAGDDIVNLAESQTNQTISGKATGEFKAGDIVSFKLDGTTYSAAVAANGQWSVSVAGSDLAKETSIHATLMAHDEAGNIGSITADHPYTVELVPGAASLAIDIVAGDDIVNLAESLTQQTISGKAAGAFTAGDIVSFKLNGTTYSAAVAADGKWSVQVAGADLAKETNIHATLVAHDTAGNTNNVSADHGYSVDLKGPDGTTTTLTINVVAGDDIVNLEESKANQTISGKATGEFKAGDIVSFKLDGTTYSAAVAANGDWSVDVPGSKLVAETSHKIDATLVAHDAAGNVGDITASHTYSVDIVPPSPSTTTLTINVVAGDDIVNLEESKANQTISGKATGEFKAGDIVSFKLDGTTYSAAVAANGDWSVAVPGSKLVADTGHKIDATLVAHDAAGNVGNITASHAYSVDVTPPVATLTINVVAGDDIVNLDESKVNQTISGKATGEFKAGDIVSFKLDGTTYSAAVAANGDWSVSVPGSKLVAETSHKIDATLVAHDAAGNVGDITASHAYSVDIVPPSPSTTTLTINVV
ncbi:Ig-like domain-containing protein, partial [Pseudomonas sp. GD03691]|uniref:Ig-like domain-containing protein n=2 Tax=unclassified Pseudomonas TaxID=196821 RepID=UPI002446F27B